MLYRSTDPATSAMSAHIGQASGRWHSQCVAILAVYAEDWRIGYAPFEIGLIPEFAKTWRRVSELKRDLLVCNWSALTTERTKATKIRRFNKDTGRQCEVLWITPLGIRANREGTWVKHEHRKKM